MLSPSDHPVFDWHRQFAAAVQLMERDLSEAAELFRGLLDELRGATGSGVNEMMGSVLGRLAECHYKLGDLPGAIVHSKAALEHAEACRDLDKVIAHSGNIIALHGRTGNDDARALAVEHLITLRETFTEAGSSDRFRASFRDAAAEINNRAGELPKEESARARSAYEAAIRLARLAEADEQLAKVLYNFASLLMTISEDLGRAEELLLEARAIQQRVLPPDHPDRTRILNNLGALYHMLGHPAKAHEHYRAALDMKGTSVVSDDADLRATLRNLVHLGGSTHDDPSRKMALERLARIDAGTAGDEEWQWVSQLSDVYLRLGNVKAAETAVMTLVAMAGTRGEHSSWYAVALHNLAAIRAAQNRPAEALALYQESISMLRKGADTSPRRLALALGNLGQFLNDSGQYTSAVPLLEEALELDRRQTAAQDVEWSWSANNLALAYLKTNRRGEAIALLEKSLDVRRRLLPEGHPSIAQAYFNLGISYIAGGANDVHTALPLLAESLRHEHLAIENAFAVSSEDERLAYLTTARACFATITASLVPRASHDGVRAMLFDATVQRKGLVGDRMTSERDALWSAGDSELAPAMTELRQVRDQLARILFDRTRTRDPELPELIRRRRDLERMLAEKVPGVDLASRLQTANRSTVAQALPPDSALIEFITFDMNASGSDETDAGYLAFVLPSGDPDGLEMIAIGLAETVQSWVETFRELLLAEIETPEEANAIVAARNDLGHRIRRLLLDPVQPILGSRTKLFLAPDGILNRFPFHLLPDAEGRPLFETYEISYLETGRDLLRSARKSSEVSSPSIVVADPDYDFGRTEPDASQPFTRLSASEWEGRQVAKILGVDPWIGAEALKSRVTAARSPHILHFATHGFAVDSHSSIEYALRSATIAAAAARNGVDETLLRSGLVLTGANTALNAGTPAEDGLLFAYDILSMDLSRTALVVLSACDTALGEYQKGEGVYGLRRAFMVAGARSLVVTLWSVPDVATAAFMVCFYTELQRGASRVNALRTAQREIRDRYGNAYWWGAFILFGDPGPLSSISGAS
jgi:CHAT domain-containing protein/tetratricopeptide (TPR) repeat protein